MAEKFLAPLPGGGKQFVEATTQSTGSADSGKIPGLDGGGKLDESLMPDGFGSATKAFPVSEGLAAGDLVSIFSDDGVFKVRKADASDFAKHADGFVKEAVDSGGVATVYFEGEVAQTVSVGISRLYLTTTPGKAGAFVESGSAIMQFVGVKTSATTFNFVAEEAIKMI